MPNYYTVDQIIDYARNNSVMPSDFTMCQQYLYSILRLIYSAYGKRLIDKPTAIAEKNHAIKMYNEIYKHEHMFLEQARRSAAISELLLDANQNGCEICKHIAKIYDGRQYN